MKNTGKLRLSGAAAGAVNGFFGASGGMVLLPLLKKSDIFPDDVLFPACLRIMVPMCFVSVLFYGERLPFLEAVPYLLGSLLGGLIGKNLKVSPLILHRALGVLILLGGGRLLW